MKRYIIEINLTGGDKIAAKVTAASPQNALKRLTASLMDMIEKNDEAGSFFKDKDIESIDIVGVETVNDDVSNIIIQKLPESDMYIVYEEGGSALTFYAGRYESTVEILPPEETRTAEDIAASVRRIGEWMAINYPELL